MCDTVGKIIADDYAIFGKNSDRAVNEAQVVEYYDAKDYEDDESLKCTYITIKQVKHTNAIVLSRPTWIWGGEIGVNEYGVCIGNEAVFTKGKYGKDALIGMDLLRLGLERGNTAFEAMNIIINLLEEYGQGGNCGYDNDFHYDNSFLIMDRKDIYVLETKDKEYVYKRLKHASISNRLTIGLDGDYYKHRTNFKAYSDLIMTFGSKGKQRQECTINKPINGLKDMIKILESHDKEDIFRCGSVGSVCMHASNSLCADQTTASMIVELFKDDIVIWIAGSSLPCISLFKPHLFKRNGLIQDLDNKAEYWYKHEYFNRKLLSCKISQEYYLDRDNYQDRIIKIFNKSDESIKEILLLDEEFFNKYQNVAFKKINSSLLYKGFWAKKNKAL